MTPLLSVRDLNVATRDHPATTLLHDVSFTLKRGERLAIVGESGSGKSLTSLAILGLLPPGLARTGGDIALDGLSLPGLRPKAMRAIRGRRIAMIFQEPMTSLNPSMTIGAQVGEMVRAHNAWSKAAIKRRVVELLDQVKLPEPHRLYHDYPHRLSGGQRQRVVIAIAIACDPDIVIADEPTTALDVTVQAQIVALLDILQRDVGMALIFISHNLGLVAQVVDRVMVMYAGRKVEEAPVAALFTEPRHPYTRGLLRATPRPGAPERVLRDIPGLVPAMNDLPPGCAFAPRCDRAMAICATAVPTLAATAPHAVAACFANADSGTA